MMGQFDAHDGGASCESVRSWKALRSVGSREPARIDGTSGRRARDISSPVTDGLVSFMEYAHVGAELSRWLRARGKFVGRRGQIAARPGNTIETTNEVKGPMTIAVGGFGWWIPR
jgi:hypothetical protein